MNIRLLRTTVLATTMVAVRVAAATARVTATRGSSTLGSTMSFTLTIVATPLVETTICLFSSNCSISFIAITRNRTGCCSISIIPAPPCISRFRFSIYSYISTISTGSTARCSSSSTSCYSYCISIRRSISGIANILIWNSKCILLSSYNITDVSLKVLIIWCFIIHLLFYYYKGRVYKKRLMPLLTFLFLI